MSKSKNKGRLLARKPIWDFIYTYLCANYKFDENLEGTET